MAEQTEYQVTYWRDLPSLVVAREGEHVTKSPLAAALPGGDRRGRDAARRHRQRRLPRRLDAAASGPPHDGSTTEVADRVVADARGGSGRPSGSRPTSTLAREAAA